MLVTVNIGGVLTPVLARLQDNPTLQIDRFFEACGLIALLGIPSCFGLALIADPLVRLCFDDRYLPSIPFLQLLSIGMAFRMVGHNGSFLMQANGRWRAYFSLSVINAIVFVVAALIGVRLGGALGLTVAVTLFYIIFGVTQLLIATTGRYGSWGERVWRLYGVPLFICAPAFMVLAVFHRQLSPPAWVGLPLLTVTGALVTVFTLRIYFPDRLTHLVSQLPVGRLLKRFKNRLQKMIRTIRMILLLDRLGLVCPFE